MLHSFLRPFLLLFPPPTREKEQKGVVAHFLVALTNGTRGAKGRGWTFSPSSDERPGAGQRGKKREGRLLSGKISRVNVVGPATTMGQ